MLWTEERKMLEYHRGRGVFYPLIQVRKPAPAAATTSLRDPPLHEGGGENGWHADPSSLIRA